MSVKLTKTPATTASQSEGYVVVLPVADLPAGFWSTDPVEFNVHRAVTNDGLSTLDGELFGFGLQVLADVTLPAGRALAFA